VGLYWAWAGGLCWPLLYWELTVLLYWELYPLVLVLVLFSDELY
jgi:hypothetical protein